MKTKDKKAAPAWYIATTHFLTAGFVPGILCGVIGAVLVHFFTADSPFLSQTIFALLVPIAAYIGVRYSARYVEHAYVLTAASRVAALASIYYGVIQVFVLAAIFLVIQSTFPEGLILIMVIAATQALAGFTVFFAMSASCLKNDPPSSTFTDPSITAGLFPTHYTPPPHVSSAVVPNSSNQS